MTIPLTATVTGREIDPISRSVAYEIVQPALGVLIRTRACRYQITQSAFTCRRRRVVGPVELRRPVDRHLLALFIDQGSPRVGSGLIPTLALAVGAAVVVEVGAGNADVTCGDGGPSALSVASDAVACCLILAVTFTIIADLAISA